MLNRFRQRQSSGNGDSEGIHVHNGAQSQAMMDGDNNTGMQAPTTIPTDHGATPPPDPTPTLPPLSVEMQQALAYVSQYTPTHRPLPTPLKPFAPEYIPAVSVIDEFIKVPRPDGQPDLLGLRVLDEPALDSSDPTMLRLQLKAAAKEGSGSDAAMACMGIIADPEKDSQRITEWLKSVAELSKSKAPAEVIYRSPALPPVSSLVEPWPPELEAAFASVELPNTAPDLELLELCRVVCALLGVPMQDARPVEALHLLFSAYLDLRASPWLGK